MSMSESDFEQIKSIIDKSLQKELPLAVASLATKEDVNKINQELNLLRQQNHGLTERVHHFENRCRLLEQELENQCKEIKGKNIIFTIPNDLAGGSSQERIESITKLLLDNQTQHQHMPEATKLSENSKTIKFKLNTGSNETATKMLKNASKLKGTGAFIQRDLSKQAQLKRRILLGYRKIAKTKTTEAIMLKNNTLIIGDKIFYLNDDNNLKYKETDGETVLQNMFGTLNFGDVSDIKMSMSNRQQPKRSVTAYSTGVVHETPNCSRFPKN